MQQTIDPDPNYSCLYVTIETDHEEYGRKYKGYGIALMKRDIGNISMYIDNTSLTCIIPSLLIVIFTVKKVTESLFDEVLKDYTTTKMYESLGRIWEELINQTFDWVIYYKIKVTNE